MNQILGKIKKGLVKACVLGDINEVLKQGISKDIEWHSPSSDYMFKKEKLNYMIERSGIALFIAAHRGNLNLVKSLITNGILFFVRLVVVHSKIIYSHCLLFERC